MTLPMPKRDRSVHLLKRLARMARQELDALRAELSSLQEEESRLLDQRQLADAQVQMAFDRLARAAAAGGAIDVDAMARLRAWLVNAQQDLHAIDEALTQLRGLIDAVIARRLATDRRMRVISRARQRRVERLRLLIGRVAQREADDAQLVRQASREHDEEAYA